MKLKIECEIPESLLSMDDFKDLEVGLISMFDTLIDRRVKILFCAPVKFDYDSLKIMISAK